MLKLHAHIQVHTKENDLKMTVLCFLHQVPTWYLVQSSERETPQLGVAKDEEAAQPRHLLLKDTSTTRYDPSPQTPQ